MHEPEHDRIKIGAAFQALHQRDRAFVIPNPWDVGSARLLASIGFEALATTSAGYSFSKGQRDNTVGRDEMLAHAAEIVAATQLPVTADLENVQLAFQRPALLWLGLLLLIPVAYFVYVRQRDNLGTIPKRFRVALSVMRVGILAVLIFAVSGPYLKIDHQVTKKPIFAVLFDSSQSMNKVAWVVKAQKWVL